MNILFRCLSHYRLSVLLFHLHNITCAHDDNNISHFPDEVKNEYYGDENPMGNDNCETVLNCSADLLTRNMLP